MGRDFVIFPSNPEAAGYIIHVQLFVDCFQELPSPRARKNKAFSDRNTRGHGNQLITKVELYGIEIFVPDEDL